MNLRQIFPPIQHVRVRASSPYTFSDQHPRVHTETIVHQLGVTDRPERLISHMAEKALDNIDKVWAPGCWAFAEIFGRMILIVIHYQAIIVWIGAIIRPKAMVCLVLCALGQRAIRIVDVEPVLAPPRPEHDCTGIGISGPSVQPEGRSRCAKVSFQGLSQLYIVCLVVSLKFWPMNLHSGLWHFSVLWCDLVDDQN